MRHIRVNFLATLAGLLLTLIALANSLVTIATNRASAYREPLIAALVFECLAVACFAVPLIRGPLRWRVVAVLFSLPALFVLLDFVQRAPRVFGG